MYKYFNKGECELNILIFGGTGFVGKQLTKELEKEENHLYIVSRNPKAYQNTNQVNYMKYGPSLTTLPPIDLVINLAGESLFGYWTKNKKEKILQSRIQTTREVVSFIRDAKEKPKVYIQASAIGYYGRSTDKIFTEKTRRPGDDFLASVVTAWEKEAEKAKEYGVRTVCARFGLILGEGGSLPLMSLPVKLFVGGKIGKGDQWISWIHIDDLIALLLHCIYTESIQGPVNFTTPAPVENKDLMKAIAKVLRRPCYFPTPRPIMRLTLGEMSELITKGQYVLPGQAEKFDYLFKYPKIEKALIDIFTN